ncbi:type VI secretion system membrane subunit TssM [Glacieibacterium megasporae]|uniref:type VI secretion system membrane subunit TssM n=1 Tax=Glacieibacterium megasporae TaxID=2835787 RepID=UPI001C1E35A8|nr:type VI secretion system membrane subunit TssM [Polymorphobacter megasporae]UAJ09828.1 type VI secretion system membrane subunit TssM [Polymorphobacter megasporae]
MAAVKRFFGNWWTLAIGATLLVTLILFFLCGPLVGVLLPARWWAIGLVWLIFAVVAGVRWFRKRAAEKALAEAMAGPADLEGEAVSAKMKAALDRAKAGGKGSLYASPWYVIIGPPGAGKTTLIQKSGLRLLNDEAAAGVGGTRNCDWWFADEAVLIDTAGRYTSQDSSADADAKGWTSFLGSLKKARPMQPLNGIIVAMGLDEIARVSADGLDKHIVAIRGRIAELGRELGLELPVYVLFTKADLVAGFVEFFDDLSVEGRRSVVGHTLPLVAARPSVAELAGGYDDVVQALADRLPARLQAETDPIRRGAALTFPARFIDLRARIIRLLDGVFGAGAAQAGATAGANGARLRGFYFTSGVQQGTPFDRLLGDLAGTLGTGTRARPSSPRAFFVNKLLSDVVIAEAGLAGPNAARRRRDRMLKLGVAIAGGLIALLLLVLLIWSYLANSKGQDATLATATSLGEGSKGLDAGDKVSLGASPAEPLDLLDALRDKLPYGATAAEHKPFGERPLYRSSLADESSRAYYDGLQRYLLPRLITTAEAALTAAGTDPVAVYEPLKVYLMLGNRAGAKRDDAYILRWLEDDLAARALPGEENAATRARIIGHAKALLADQGSFGRQLTGPLLDASLVERGQATMAAMSPAERALALMKQQVSGDDWRLVGDGILKGEADAFANPGELAGIKVPYLFTKKGFLAGFIPNVAGIGKALDADRWMLGASAAAQAPLDTSELGQLYAAEYTKRWTAVLAAPQPGDYARDPMALARLSNPASSPLKKLTDAIVANTTALLPNIKAPALPGGALGKLAGDLAGKEMKGSASQIAAKTIEDNFAGMKEYTAGDSAPLKQLLGALGKYQLALAQAKVGGGGGAGGGGGGGSAGGGGGSGAIAAAAAELSVAAANAGAAVPALSDFVAHVAGGSSKAAETQRTTELRDAYAQKILPDCGRIFGAGYPFGDGADLAPADVTRVAGLVAGFGRDSLQPYLKKDGDPKKGWTWTSEPTVKGFQAGSAAAFQRAADTEGLMGGNLVLRLAAAPTNKGGLRLRAGGVPMDLMPQSPAERFSWSSGGSQVAEYAQTGLPAGTTAAPPLREEGPWALFRVLGHAKKTQLGPGKYRFAFTPDSALDVEVAGGPDPFTPTGPFALRCPAKL